MEKRILQHLFGVFLFCLPFSHPFLLWSWSSFASGNFSVWSAFFLQFQVIFLLAIVIWGSYLFVKHFVLRFPVLPLPLFFFVLSAIPLLFFVSDPTLHFLALIQFILLFFAFSFLQVTKPDWKLWGKYFLSSMLFVSLLSVLQIIFQHSMGFSFFGEPELAANILGVAKIDVGAEKFIRAYGTFQHPNILAFFSVVAFYLAQKIEWRYIKWLFLIPIFLSFSRAGWLAFAVSYFAFFHTVSRKNIFALGIFTLTFFGLFSQQILARFTFFDAAFTERITGMIASATLLFEHPLGLGFQHFTLALPSISSKFLFPWDIQPVHNVWLLILNEGGIFVFGFLLWFLVQIWKVSGVWQRQILIALLVFSVFDHFLWTSFSALAFTFFLCFSCFQKE